jgi:hypothetical protein
MNSPYMDEIMVYLTRQDADLATDDMEVLRTLIFSEDESRQDKNAVLDTIFEWVVGSIHRMVEILDEMVTFNAESLAQIEAMRQRIDSQIDENRRGLERLIAQSTL